MLKRNNYFKIPSMDKEDLNLRGTLEFYIAAGVDETCGDGVLTLSDRDKILPQTKENISGTAARPATSALALSSAAAVKNADDICRGVGSIDELRQIVENFDGCSLKYNAKHTVIGDGNPAADVMFIGEAPGAEEDMVGKAFVGRSGQLLDKMLAAVGLDRSQCYICNILPWRPPGNRSPSDAEIAVCLPFLKKQIELVKPEYIFLLGAVAANSLLGCSEGISHLRGRWMEYEATDGRKIKVLAGYHPAYLLRTPAQKAKAWADFLRLKKKLNENN